jgi:hypothetical protein
MKQTVMGVGSHFSHSVYALGGQMKHMVAGVGHSGVEGSATAAAATDCDASEVSNEVTTRSSGFSLDTAGSFDGGMSEPSGSCNHA